MEARSELRPTHVAWVLFHQSISETEWLSHPWKKRFMQSTSTWWGINWEYVYGYLVKHTTQGVTWTWKLELLVGPPLHPCHSYDVFVSASISLPLSKALLWVLVSFGFLICAFLGSQSSETPVLWGAIPLALCFELQKPFSSCFPLSIVNLNDSVWCSSVGGTLPINRDIVTVIVYMENHRGKREGVGYP